jgi:sortase A
MKEKTKRRIKLVFFLMLLIVALLLIFNNQIQEAIVRHNSQSFTIANVNREEILENQKKITQSKSTDSTNSSSNITNSSTKKEQDINSEEKANAQNTDGITFDFSAVEPISTQAVVEAQLNKKNSTYPVVAGIAIPSVNLNLPIFLGLANENLLWGAGTMSPSQLMGSGNYALASHLSYDPYALFSPLVNVSMGDRIYLNDLTNVYIYETYSKKSVAPDATEVLDEVPGQAIVTLVTCGDYDATSRLIIQGQLVDVVPVDQMTTEMTTAFGL